MDPTPIILAITTTVVAPLVGLFAYFMRKRTDGQYRALNARIESEKRQAQKELEQVKAEAAQAMAAAESIRSLATTISVQAEDRKESTAATKENTTALNSVKVSIVDWDSRQQLFFRNLTNIVTQFSGEAGAAIRKLEETVAGAIGALGGKVDGVVPALADQVKPLVSEISLLVDEIKRVNAVEETAASGKMERIESMFGQLVEIMSRLETAFGQSLRPPEPAPEPETVSDVATVEFALEPAGV